MDNKMPKPFIPQDLTDSLETKETPEGLITLIGKEEVPLLNNISKITVVQSMHLNSPENKEKYKDHVGKIYNETLGMSFDTLELLPMIILQYGRRLYSEYDSSNTELICYSSDGIHPSPKVESPISKKCGECVISPDDDFTPTCPKAIWINGKPPECKDVITVVFLDLKWKIPIQIQFTSTRMTAWKNFKNEYRLQKEKARILRKPIPNFFVEMKSKEDGIYTEITMSLKTTEESLDKYTGLVAWYFKHVFVPMQEKQNNMLLNTNTLSAEDYDVNVSSIDENDNSEKGKDFDI